MPAVIVESPTEINHLLSKYEGRNFKLHALIAGFAEIGETIEETVQREVMEEVGLKVKNFVITRASHGPSPVHCSSDFFCDVDGDDTLTVDHEELSIPNGLTVIRSPDRK